MRLLHISLSITMLLSMLMFAGIGLGALHPPHPALAGLSACTTLCWYGIRPGVTSLDDARDIAEEHADVYAQAYQPRTATYSFPAESELRLLSMRYDNRLVESLSVIPDGDVMLGDLMAELGDPDGVLINPNFIILLYHQGAMGITLLNDPKGRSSPTMFQHNIEGWYITTDRLSGLKWRGFAPTWRYCQLEKGAYGCR